MRDAGRFRALVLGPGLGTDAAARAEATLLAAQAPVPLVLDADGLNALEGDLAPLRVRRAGLSEATVLTPHGGEYARLTGRPVGDDRLAATRRLADDSESVVLLKGPGTVVAEPGGRAVVNPTGGPWLATAGTGDVLAGILGAFLARGLPAFEAAAAAAWVHGRSADVAADALDAGPEPEGILAGDLVGAIPRTLAALRRATTTEEA
ncbi:MAG: NAD(P)H-hydrate dehydratase [Acidimicrobiia bacterium]|nr:NAD(P)H-hydrate dehydratase [Acidimicrobiia bacterium]